MGMAAFQQAYGKPLQLYAPYFCDTSDYAKNFSMIKSDTSLPGCGDMSFWDRATGIVALKTRLEAEQGRALTLRPLEDALHGLGLAVGGTAGDDHPLEQW